VSGNSNSLIPEWKSIPNNQILQLRSHPFHMRPLVAVWTDASAGLRQLARTTQPVPAEVQGHGRIGNDRFGLRFRTLADISGLIFSSLSALAINHEARMSLNCMGATSDWILATSAADALVA